MITYTAEQQALLDDHNQEVKLLVEIIAPTATLRYCTGAEPMVVSANLYVPRAMRPTDLDYAAPNEVRMAVDISNSDNAISDEVMADQGINGCDITLRLYLRRKAAGSSWLLFSTWTMQVSGLGLDADWARFTMTGFVGMKPHHILTVGSRTCSNRGGDGRCQYGSDIVCGGTWEECLTTFGNTLHYVGFRYAPDPDQTIELNYFTIHVPGDLSPRQQQRSFSDWLRYPGGIHMLQQTSEYLQQLQNS